MSLILRPSGFPLCIGHRGAAGHAPENTLASLEQAIALGVDLVEFDVRQSADGALVVFHDETVERTTNGAGKLEDFSLQALRTLDAGGGERILLLGEALACLSGRAGAMIEMKIPGIAPQVCGAVDAIRFRGSVVYASFLHEELQKVSMMKPEAEVLALFEDVPEHLLAYVGTLPITHVGLALETVTSPLVQALQLDKKKVFVYTVDTSDDIVRIMEMRVDGIITNYPERLSGFFRNRV
ncbi:MAG: hypothetical protein KC590_04775 [Nitrospira sp.]|nr:hypothetical protein [Nitrospira sp.]